MTGNDLFDSDTVMLEVILRANPASTPGTYGFTARATMDTSETSAIDFDKSTDFISTSDFSSIDTVCWNIFFHRTN